MLNIIIIVLRNNMVSHKVIKSVMRHTYIHTVLAKPCLISTQTQYYRPSTLMSGRYNYSILWKGQNYLK